jgi:hypothetical protein
VLVFRTIGGPRDASVAVFPGRLVNVAVTVSAVEGLTLHVVALPVQAPVQPMND